MLPAAHRLRRSDQFRAVLRGRHAHHRLRRGRAGGDLMTVHVIARSPEDGTSDVARVGFVVSKGVGNSVVRHRTQRRLRHQAAGVLGQLPDDADVVVRAHPRAAEVSSAQLRSEMERLLDRALRGLAGSGRPG